MISGLTEAASGLGEPSMMPLPGTTTRAPKSWPIDISHRPPPRPWRRRPRSPRSHRRSTAVPPAGWLTVPSGQATAGARGGRRRDIDPAAIVTRPTAAPLRSASPCATYRPAGCRPPARPARRRCAPAQPWKNSAAAALADAAQDRGEVRLGEERALPRRCRKCAAPRRRRRAGAPPACRSRASARDTWHAEARQPLGRATPSAPSAAGRDGHASG